MFQIRAILVLLTALSFMDSANADDTQVRAVLFYSPTCPHCHKVIDEVLPPLLEKHQGRLVVIGVNVRIPEGQSLFSQVMNHFGIPQDDWGVPALVIGDK